MIKKIIPIICRDAFFISFVFLLFYYLADLQWDGYIRYYFDPGWIMIFCLAVGVIWIVFEKQQEG